MNYEVTVRFAKLNLMRFISHLDLMRLFQRAVRRSGLPVSFSQGFNPHLKLKIIPAIKLGLESNDLKAIIQFEKKIENTELMALLKANLPTGIEILEVS